MTCLQGTRGRLGSEGSETLSSKKSPYAFYSRIVCRSFYDSSEESTPKDVCFASGFARAPGSGLQALTNVVSYLFATQIYYTVYEENNTRCETYVNITILRGLARGGRPAGRRGAAGPPAGCGGQQTGLP